MTTLPHGSWPAPMSTADALAAGIERRQPLVDRRAAGTDVHWLEARPADAGRSTLVRRGADGTVSDVSPAGHDVRTMLHEYGGVPAAVADGVAIWADRTSDRLWVAEPGADPRAVTPATGGAVRFGALCVDAVRRCAYAVREDQRDRAVEPVTSLVRLSLDPADPDRVDGPGALGVVLVAGRVRAVDDRDTGSGPDFVSEPALSPDGRRLAWLTWDHPRMPWHGTVLHVAELDDAGDLRDPRELLGGPGEAVEQPEWIDADHLVCVSDRTGWGDPVRIDVVGGEVRPVRTDEVDRGMPRWVPGMTSYALLPPAAGGEVVERLASVGRDSGRTTLGVVDLATGELRDVPVPLTAILEIRALDADRVVCTAMAADRARALVVVDLRTGECDGLVEPWAPDPVLGAYASAPRHVSWTSPGDGTGDATAYGWLYLPRHPDVTAPAGELPPLLVTLHGGPTAAAQPGLTTWRTFWTSRGFAVLDVDYGGSTGYGRDYRERLDGQWGVVDVADVVSGARHLAGTGVVDGSRLVVTGGSAGGFTVLAALTSTDAFAAGASHFGVSDLGALARDTHKLESRYLDGLVAPWPQRSDVYAARSPINHTDRLTSPLIVLQGTDDKVVPQAQAELMVDALRERGQPVAYVLFEGEGHGFRALDNRVRALEAELSFYGQVLGFEPAGDVPRIEVENL